MTDEGGIAAIILAAGRSSRMGSHKLLLPLGARPVLAHVVAAACATAATPIVVVLGHEAEHVRAALPAERWEATVNAAYVTGMSSSLRAGIAWLEARVAAPVPRGALVLLGDQPLVTAAMMTRMLDAAGRFPHDLCAATFAGERRSPVYFPREFFGDIEALEGDEGGRSILERHHARVRLVPLEPAEAALDVDSPPEYARVRAYWERYCATDAS